MGVEPKIGVLTPQIIHFNRVSHYKPSILGYPYFWKHPHLTTSVISYPLPLEPSFIWRLSPQFFPGVSRIQSSNLCEKARHRHLLPRHATISCNDPWLLRQGRRENRHCQLQNETTFLSPCFLKLVGWLSNMLQLDSWNLHGSCLRIRNLLRGFGRKRGWNRHERCARSLCASIRYKLMESTFSSNYSTGLSKRKNIP